MSPVPTINIIKVGPYTLDIITDHLDECDGKYEAAKTQITITNKDISSDYNKYLLMHELIHALFDVYGLLHGVTDLAPGDVEEYLAQSMSTAIIALIKDNPDLVEVIQN